MLTLYSLVQIGYLYYKNKLIVNTTYFIILNSMAFYDG